MKLLSNVLTVLVIAGVMNGLAAGEKSDRPLDKDFLVKIASANYAEIEIGKLADKQSNSADVKGYAMMLVKDHKAANDKLGGLIKTRNIGVVAGLEKEAREEMKKLGKLEGKEFDRAFLDLMVRDHKKVISLFENQANNGQEADIRNFAKELLPDLRKHLKKAQELAGTAGR